MQPCAVLVDVENVPHRSLEWIMHNLDSMGYLAILRRAYGDFRKPNLQPWNEPLTKFSFEKVSAPSYVPKKGTSDMAMIIGAMDMLYNRSNIKCFVLVTSDSDFTPLVRRLKQSGKKVVGFGGWHTTLALVNEYKKFVYIEDLGFSMPTILEYTMSTKETSKNLSKRQLIQFLRRVIREHSDQGWASLSAIGQHFDCKHYGHSKVSKYFDNNWVHFQMDTSRQYVRNL
mmetsp:Transcript_23424/g.57619  ORF Transcript_23424/g.57619 Transcript_23424/m.57619 type:complete len:228 (-) Transcript_23424:206-889(-)